MIKPKSFVTGILNKLIIFSTIIIVLFCIYLISISPINYDYVKKQYSNLNCYYVFKFKIKDKDLNEQILSGIIMDINKSLDIYKDINKEPGKNNLIYIIHNAVNNNFVYKKGEFDCKYWSCVYNQLLGYFNIENQPILFNDHISVIAKTDDKYCILDQKVIDCIKLNK